LRTTDYIQQEPELIARSFPIRRQQLAALDEAGGALGGDPHWEPASRYSVITDYELG